MATILVAVFCEGMFVSIEQCPNLDHARGFGAGLVVGVEVFDGGRLARAYALPEEESAMREGQNSLEVEKALREAAEVVAEMSRPVCAGSGERVDRTGKSECSHCGLWRGAERNGEEWQRVEHRVPGPWFKRGASTRQPCPGGGEKRRADAGYAKCNGCGRVVGTSRGRGGWYAAEHFLPAEVGR